MDLIVKDNNKMINFMDLDRIIIKMELHILVNGKKINNMEKENKFFPTEIDMKVNIKRVKKKDLDHIIIKMEPHILVNGKKVKITEKEN